MALDFVYQGAGGMVVWGRGRAADLIRAADWRVFIVDDLGILNKVKKSP